MTLRLTELNSFRKEAGHCWVAKLPSELVEGDIVGRPSTSQLMLFEDGRALWPWRAKHDEIRNFGSGAFSHWGKELWFSSSDNTDPAANGRRYVALVEDTQTDTQFKRQPAVDYGAVPVNFQPLNATAESIERDANYAISIAQSYVDCLPGGRTFLLKRSLLELGPGHHFGTGLAMLCWGASQVAVADRFLVPFDRAYHTALYDRLGALLEVRQDVVSLSPIRECIERQQHQTSGLITVASPLEELSSAIDEPFDITASNAVFEHLFDPFRAIRCMHTLTKGGGIGLHQVDFRDHRTFERPLEFLLDDERSFAVIFEQNHGEMGNRLRPYQMEAMFHDAGFSNVEFTVNMLAEPSYLHEFIPRLRTTTRSSHKDISIDNLRPVSGRFVVRKAPAIG